MLADMKAEPGTARRRAEGRRSALQCAVRSGALLLLVIASALPHPSRAGPRAEAPGGGTVDAQFARPIDGSVAQQGQISLQRAIEMAQRRYPGQVVRADKTMRNGRVVYVIRILGDDNRVRTVEIDAESHDAR